MKTPTFLKCLALSVSGLFLGVVTAFAGPENETAQTSGFEYKIKGMKCQTCIESLKTGVCGLKGIERCDVSLGKMVVTFDKNSVMDQETVIEAVKAAGHFKVLSVKPTTLNEAPAKTQAPSQGKK